MADDNKDDDDQEEWENDGSFDVCQMCDSTLTLASITFNTFDIVPMLSCVVPHSHFPLLLFLFSISQIKKIL